MNTKDWDQKYLINELNQGKEFVNQLRLHLSPTSPNGQVLIEKIISSYDKALLLLNCIGAEAEAEPQAMVPSGGGRGGITGAMTESPRSASGSPRSDDSEYKDMYKKRKMLPRWTEQVQVSSETGLEGPVEDGFSWRKYGQKDILGATYPRGYFRCTHRNAHGCLATKQVQRCDDNPSVFDVTYRGKHTCIQASRLNPTFQQSNQKQDQKIHQEAKRQKHPEEILLNFRTGLKVKTENLDSRQFSSSSSFSFPSTSSMEYSKPESNIFSSFGIDNNLVGNFSPPFISPTTSESNYFSPCHMGGIGGGSNLPTSESAATSSTNSPILDLDFALTPLEFDGDFFFDNPGFFN